jgi:hypothetical protein
MVVVCRLGRRTLECEYAGQWLEPRCEDRGCRLAGFECEIRNRGDSSENGESGLQNRGPGFFIGMGDGPKLAKPRRSVHSPFRGCLVVPEQHSG